MSETIIRPYDTNKFIAYNWFEAMNTRVDLVICHETEKLFEPLFLDIQDLIMEFQFIANRFDPYSELSRINKSAYFTPFNVSPKLYKIIKQAIFYYQLCLGYFDITVNSMNHHTATINYIELSDEFSSIRFLESGIILDLNGFIKGYVLDRIAEILNRYKIENALINLGNSSIMAIGDQPNTKGWQLALQEDRNTVVLRNQCLTTSGNLTENHSHIKDPYSGKILEEKRTISVITQLGELGEALSTALFIADTKDRNQILNSFSESFLVH